MTDPRHHWLHVEIDRWQGDGLIDQQAAERLRSRYPLAAAPAPRQDEGIPLVAMILGGIGALAAGLGVIALIAFNWQELPRLAKLGLILAGLAGAHLGGSRLLQRPRWAPLGHGLHLLGTLLFGAGIWLVAQAYHIDEHWPSGFLIWALGAWALAWAQPSRLQALLGCILLMTWGLSEASTFTPVHLAAPLIVLLSLPLARRGEAPVLIAVAVPVALVALAVDCGSLQGGSEVLLPLLTAWGTTLVALGSAASIRGMTASARVLGFLGSALVIGCLFVLSFPDVIAHLVHHVFFDLLSGAVLYFLASIITVPVSWILVMLLQRRCGGRLGAHRLLHLAAILLLLAGMFLPLQDPGWLLAIPVNLLLLAMAIDLIVRGGNAGRWAPMAAGTLVAIALLLCRFADTFGSLWLRGLVLLLIGAGLVAEGALWLRGRRASREAAA